MSLEARLDQSDQRFQLPLHCLHVKGQDAVGSRHAAQMLCECGARGAIAGAGRAAGWAGREEIVTHARG
jgi:hypothetical protein